MSEVEIERDGAVASLILARPAVRNAMNEAMGRAVARAVEALNAEPAVWVVLVRGQGKAFCAGGDLSLIDQRVASDPGVNFQAMRTFYDLFLSIRDLRVPSIAVVHGTAMGAGLCFAMACDVRLAAAGAPMGLNFVKLGLHPGMGATWLLPRLCGPAKAAELMLTGKVITAEEACRIGLVNDVYPADMLLDAARDMAAAIAAAAPLAVAQCKQSLQGGWARDLGEALDNEARAQKANFATEDVVEGVRAIRERRVPRFTGR